MGPCGKTWYPHQVLQSMKDGKQANSADWMLYNRSLNLQLKGESLDYTKLTIRLSDVIISLLVLITLQRQQLWNDVPSPLKTTFLFYP